MRHSTSPAHLCPGHWRASLGKERSVESLFSRCGFAHRSGKTSSWKKFYNNVISRANFAVQPYNVAREIVFKPQNPAIGAPLHSERVVAVREEPNLHLDSRSYLHCVGGPLKPWSDEPVKESCCKVLNPGSRVQRVLTRSDRNAEWNTVTLIEEKREITFVEEGLEVERVAAILRNLHCNEIYQCRVCDKMRLEFGGRTIVAKDTLSMVKLAEKIEETSSDVIGYGMVSFAVTPYPDKVWRVMLYFFSRTAEWSKQVDGVSFQKGGFTVRSMHLIPKQGVVRQL